MIRRSPWHISRLFKSLFATSDITCNTSFYLWEASAYLSVGAYEIGKSERGDEREGGKKKHGCDDGLPDKGRGTDCYEILSNVRVSAQGASVRDLRAGKTRCSRIRVFVDRANGCRCIHIQNHVHRRRPFPSNFLLCAEALQDIQDVPELPSFLSTTVLRVELRRTLLISAYRQFPNKVPGGVEP